MSWLVQSFIGDDGGTQCRQERNLHCSLFCVACISSVLRRSVQSDMLSIHAVAGLPRLLLPATKPCSGDHNHVRYWVTPASLCVQNIQAFWFLHFVVAQNFLVTSPTPQHSLFLQSMVSAALFLHSYFQTQWVSFGQPFLKSS